MHFKFYDTTFTLYMIFGGFSSIDF